MKKFLTPTNKKVIVDYCLAVAASAVTMAIALLINMKPEYAILIGAVTAPATKWASKHSKDYGRGTQK